MLGWRAAKPDIRGQAVRVCDAAPALREREPERLRVPAGAVDGARQDHVHQALLYNSDEEFLAGVVPFLEEGLDAAQPTIVVMNERVAALLAAAVGHPELVFLDPRERRHDPASAIRGKRELMAKHVANGAQRIRVVGETPHPGLGAPWEWWARYEAAINHLYAGFPLWNICPYDLRITPSTVIDDVTRTHPWLSEGDGSHVTNPHYEDPGGFLAARPVPLADPLQHTRPLVDLHDPTPADARRAARSLEDLTTAAEFDIDDVVLAASEAVTNALTHGARPVTMRLWAARHRIIATISDHGSGPTDPFAGLLPTEGSQSGGLGLWIAHQVCDHVTIATTEDGFTITLQFDARGRKS
jgi:anti-sigma regulatory factor (Ser/Thr protein kinase)